MATASGTANNPNDLLTALASCAVAGGFTASGGSLISGAGSAFDLSAASPTLTYYGYNVPTTDYYTLGAKCSFSGNYGTDSTPTGFNGMTCGICIPQTLWPVGYNFFSSASPSLFFGVITYTIDLIPRNLWITFGDLQKASPDYVGGAFLAGTYNFRTFNGAFGFVEQEIGCDVVSGDCGGFFYYPSGGFVQLQDDFRNSWCYTDIDGGGWMDFIRLDQREGLLLQISPSPWNNAPYLSKCRLIKAIKDGLVMDLGVIPGLCRVKLDYLTDGQALTLGSDTWKVFAMSRLDRQFPLGYNNCMGRSIHTLHSTITDPYNDPFWGPRTGTFGFAVKV